MLAYPVKFAPLIKPRIWGGDRLKGLFRINRKEPVGEYWVLSGLAHDSSVVVNGVLAGKTLAELVRELPEEYLGVAAYQEFPLLVKFLEANQHLSVQIHPDDDHAQQQEGSLGKTEAWYILDHEPGAKVILGHDFPDAPAFWQAVRDRQVINHLQEIEIERDRLIFVPARTLHALKAGTTLIEIQQSSDITYRVYDWDRVDADGRGRELHLEQAAQVMTYDEAAAAGVSQTERSVLQEGEGILHEHLLTCSYFTIEKLCLTDAVHAMQTGRPGNPDVWIVAEGEGALISDNRELHLQAGDTVLVPASMRSYQLKAATRLTLLRTYY